MIGAFSAFLSSVTWAIGSARYSVLSQRFDPFSVNFARATFALPLFLILEVWTAGGIGPAIAEFSQVTPMHLGWFALSMFSSYGMGDVVFLKSTQVIGVPTALAIASIYPLWTAMAAWVFRGEALVGLQWFGLFLTLAGVVLVILKSPQAAQHSQLSRKHLTLGVALALGTSLFWAVNSYCVAEGGRDLPVPVSNSIRMVYALIFSFGLGFLFLRKRIGLPALEYRKSGWLFALESFGGSYFYLYGLTHSPLAVGTVMTSLAPVISVPVVVLLGLERLSWGRTFAIGMVVTGICLLLNF